MLANYFLEQIKEIFKFEPTDEQNDLLTRLSDFYLNNGDDGTFILKGYAGTGKTSIMAAFIQHLVASKQKVILLAPTGRAAKVLSHWSRYPAFTIHKFIYRQRSSGDDFGSFELDRNLNRDTIFVVDEASMISNSASASKTFGTGRLLDDFLSFIDGGQRCKIVFVGDLAQLPPVGTLLSPALDANELQAYGLNVEEFTLREVVRQSADSGILENATMLRQMLRDKQFGVFPKFNLLNFSDLKSIGGDEVIEHISESFNQVGLSETIVVTRSNKRANLFNQGVRQSILFQEEELMAGDLLLVVKNNYFWTKEYKELDFIANGDLAEVTKISGYADLYGCRFADVTVRLLDAKDVEIELKINLDVLTHDGPSLDFESMQKLYDVILEDYPELTNRQSQFKQMRENEYYNALQVKYGYALTCHKSQGGQWKHVYIDQGYLTDEMLNMEFLRWLYTALTRATEKVFLVNFNDEFF